MVQIVKRKKKGRPSKADLAERGSLPGMPVDPELQQRNVRHNIDYDDYIDEDFEDAEEEERKREKKLTLLLKLNQSQEAELPSPPLVPSRSRSVSSASMCGMHMVEEVEEQQEDDDNQEEEGSEKRKKKIKKRRISSGDEEEEEEVDDDDEDEDEDEDDDYDDDDDHCDCDCDVEMRGRIVEFKGQDSVPGIPSDPPSGIPLPDKKTLELILDKLQKKDIYGVYAEPADPEELPDYMI